jgi:peptide/nickel transport system permease protein
VIRYIIHRILISVVVMLGVTVIAFILMNLIASGPRLALAIIGPRATTGAIHAFVQQYGLDRPLPLRYVSYLWQLLHGNLGHSYKLNLSVDSIIASELPKDLLLVGTSLVLSLLIAVPVGLVQAVRRNGVIDYTATALSFILYSMPSYWLGLLLIAGFSIQLHVFPPEAPQATSVGGILADPTAMILPVATLTLVSYALFSRYMRSSGIENLAQDFIRTARAKGLRRRQVVLRHLLRNSLLPIITLVGLSVPAIITSGLIVEYVFNFPGLGLSFFNAAQNLDYPVELGITVLVGFATVAGNLIADIAYAVLDPRVRYSTP